MIHCVGNNKTPSMVFLSTGIHVHQGFPVLLYLSLALNVQIKPRRACDNSYSNLLFWLTWHPSSFGRACFVTVGAIDPKLWTYVSLGKSN
jgi:hypothetical protein